MAVQLNIPYETLVTLVDQLTDEQKRDLLLHLAQQTAHRALTSAEKLSLYHASILDNPVNQAPSLRREDWYE